MDEGILDIYKKSIDINSQRVSEGLNEHKKDLAIVYSNRGRAFINFGRYEEAIDDFTRVIEINQDLKENNERLENEIIFQAYSNRGKAYSYLDKQWEAIKDFSESISLKENSLKAGENINKSLLAQDYRDRGMSFMELDKAQKSIDNYSQAIKIYQEISKSEEDITDKNEFAALYMSKGIALIMTKNYKEAVEELDKAYDIQKILYDKGELLNIPVIITTIRSRIVANTKLGNHVDVSKDQITVKEYMTKMF